MRCGAVSFQSDRYGDIRNAIKIALSVLDYLRIADMFATNVERSIHLCHEQRHRGLRATFARRFFHVARPALFDNPRLLAHFCLAGRATCRAPRSNRCDKRAQRLACSERSRSVAGRMGQSTEPQTLPSRDNAQGSLSRAGHSCLPRGRQRGRTRAPCECVLPSEPHRLPFSATWIQR